MTNKLKLSLLGIAIGATGAFVVVMAQESYQTVLGVWCMIWGNNIEKVKDGD